MKKIIPLMFGSLLTVSPIAFAGGMGDGSMACCSGFVSLEGGYTWNSIRGFNFVFTDPDFLGTLGSTVSHQGGSGRLALGVIDMFDDEWAGTGEIAWGYYGRTTVDPVPTGAFIGSPLAFSSSHTLSGFDALVGMAYVDPCYSISLKVGAMFQNLTTSFSANLLNTVPPIVTPLAARYVSRTNTTAVLPALKVGASYNFLSNWSLTASYLYAYGDNHRIEGFIDTELGTADVVANFRNPMMSVGLLGIQYTF